MKLSEALHSLGRPVTYYPSVVCALGGSVNTAAYLSQFIYWEGKEKDPRGVYKTKEDIQRETGLSERCQDTCRARLESLGILKVTLDRIHHRMFYDINFDALDALWEKSAQCWEEGGHPQKRGSGNTETQLGSHKNAVRHIQGIEDQRIHSGNGSKSISFKQCDETHKELLKKEELYKPLNVDLEWDKCRLWCKTNTRAFSKKMFVNWLNRCLDRVPKAKAEVELF